jgi:putative polyhydroxyalkanoate system protein
MADLHIQRKHSHGLKEIRKIAFTWAELAEEEFGLSCTYQEGELEDELFFTGLGVRGRLLATHDTLEITVELGVLIRAFKPNIESQIVKNLDLLLQCKSTDKKSAGYAKRR